MNQRRVDRAKERLWRDRVKRQQQSGLSILAFCAEQSISEASFHWWRRELRRRQALERSPAPTKFATANRSKGRRAKPSPVSRDASAAPPAALSLPAAATPSLRKAGFGRRQSPSRLVPVTVTASPPCATIEIALPGGVTVRIPQGCSSQLLREVLAALEIKRC